MHPSYDAGSIRVLRFASRLNWHDFDQYDRIFIDGAHDRPSVDADIQRGLSVLDPDGLFAFHDYRRKPGEIDGRWDPGVSEAVDELVASGATFISRHGTLAVVRPSAHILSEV